MANAFDVILVGGGLQSGLIALAIFDQHPQARLAIVESQSVLGGAHTWSFHDTDIPTRCWSWLEPIVGASWPDYEVRFPNRTRVVPIGYHSIFSRQFDEVVRQRFEQSTESSLLLGRRADRVEECRVLLDDGLELSAPLVMDARGPQTITEGAGYQKFVGIEVELDGDVAPTRPIVMDATVAQIDGFRFVYVLPFARDRCLIEDTYFSDQPELDPWSIRPRLDEYLDRLGWRYRRIVREEEGVLPMPWSGALPTGPTRGPLVAGYRGGWYHPGTGYSLPIAVRLARHVADRFPETPFDAGLATMHRRHERQFRFARFLNRMLFRAFDGPNRWNVFERFYRMPAGAIGRFYSLEMSAADRLRLVSGRPPRGISWVGLATMFRR